MDTSSNPSKPTGGYLPSLVDRPKTSVRVVTVGVWTVSAFLLYKAMVEPLEGTLNPIRHFQEHMIGNDAAAKVFVDALAPAAVGTVTGDGGILEKWWWLLLVLLAVILFLWFLMRKKP